MTAPSTLPSATQQRTAAVQRTLAVILVLNVVVVGVKVVVAARTGALSVVGATVESALDAMNNVIAILLVALAARGPDEDHPYGHDKFETLGALVIVGFLSISCFELVRNAVTTLVHHETPATPTSFELTLLGATALINILVVWYERKRGRALGSALLLADAAHTGGDIFVTGIAFLSLWLARLGYPKADAWLTLIVAMVIAYSGYQILKVTVPILVDERGVDADEIRRVVAAIAGITGVPMVRSRTTASGMLFAEVTIRCDGTLPVAAAHELADAAEAAIRASIGAADVTVHIEPA
ncbi:MAG: cation diffusion facilitator family transporter [Gemmatimonadetes bacterium]|nr:cation diffusion facilitator family transporter [Gemmatimonadota bacterium]